MAGSSATAFLPLSMEKNKLLSDTFEDLSLLSKMVTTPSVLIADSRISARTVQELAAGDSQREHRAGIDTRPTPGLQ